MKGKTLGITAVAFLMGLGVAVGAHQQNVTKVEASNTYGADWWITGTVGGKNWGDFQKISTHNEDLGRYEITLKMTTSSEFKIFNHAAYGDFELNRSNSKLDYDHKGWETYTEWVQGNNFKMKEAGDFIIWFDEYIEDYDDVEWAFGIEKYVVPVVASRYKYSLNGGTAVEMNNGTGTEVVSGALSFKKGDVVSFLKDNEAYTVTPKEDNQLTKVYSVTGGLKFAEDYQGALYLETADATLWAGQFTPGYYLAGVNGEWNPKLATPAVKESQGDSYYVSNIQLSAGTEVKFIEAPTSTNSFVWFKAEEGKTSSGSEVGYEIVHSEEDDDGNFIINYAGTYNLYFNPTNNWYSIEDVNYNPVEGYFIMGDVSGVDHWQYNNPVVKMNNTTQGGNVALKMNQPFGVGDKIRVRGYHAEENPKVIWGNPGDNAEAVAEYGNIDGQNFEFTKAGAYDIYAKKEGGVLYFYVAEHAITYNIQMTGVLFEGKVRASTVDLGIQLAYKGQTFNPELSDRTGYVRKGVFTDANCTVEYTPSVFTGADNLYVKYIKVGFYILHSDSTPAYSIDGADLMLTDGISPQNKAEGTIVANVGTTFSVGEYKADGTMGGHSGLGSDSYGYVSNVDGNFVFSVAGTYSIFWSAGDNKVYITKGIEAFLSYFLSEIGGICDAQGVDTNLTTLHNAWVRQEAAYNALVDTDKAKITAMGFDCSKATEADKNKDEYKMVKMLSYIVLKYGTNRFNDFVFNTDHVVNISPFGLNTAQMNNGTIALIVIIGVVAISATSFLVIKHKKKLEE